MEDVLDFMTQFLVIIGFLAYLHNYFKKIVSDTIKQEVEKIKLEVNEEVKIAQTQRGNMHNKLVNFEKQMQSKVNNDKFQDKVEYFNNRINMDYSELRDLQKEVDKK